MWLQSLQMASASTGWALYYPANPATSLSPSTRLAWTTDGARTWVDVTPSAAGPLLATTYANEVLDVAGGAQAYLAVTASSQSSPPAVATTEVFATADGGRTWSESAPVKDAGYVIGVSFVNSALGWLLMSEGAAMGRNPVQVYRTTDGGAHWSLIAQSPSFDSASETGIPIGCDKTGIVFASATAGWISGACTAGPDALLVSRDGGVTWAAQSLPACQACAVFGPEFTAGTGFLTLASEVADGIPALLVSHDLGQTWEPLPLPAGSGMYPHVKFFGPQRGVLVSAGAQGSIGTVFYTTSDGGQTWTAVPQGVHFTQLGAAIDFASPLAGFAWFAGGDSSGAAPPAIYVTTNSGRTWTPVSPLLAG